MLLIPASAVPRTSLLRSTTEIEMVAFRRSKGGKGLVCWGVGWLLIEDGHMHTGGSLWRSTIACYGSGAFGV